MGRAQGNKTEQGELSEGKEGCRDGGGQVGGVEATAQAREAER